MRRISIKENPKQIIIAVLIALAVILYVVVMINKVRTKRNLDSQHSELESVVSSVKDENSKISESIENGENESYLEDIARSEYSYVNPEERVYLDNDAS